MTQVETIKIQSKDTESGCIIINASDFDGDKHKRYVEPKPSKGKAADASDTAPAETE